MGTGCIDYIIADRLVIPEAAQIHYAEAVAYLPDTFQANDLTRAISTRAPTRAEAGLPTRAFVYCSFNSQYKITSHMFDIWMRLLRQREGSVLWLLGGNATIEGNLQREARARGVDPARLVFAPRLRYAEHSLLDRDRSRLRPRCGKPPPLRWPQAGQHRDPDGVCKLLRHPTPH